MLCTPYGGEGPETMTTNLLTETFTESDDWSTSDDDVFTFKYRDRSMPIPPRWAHSAAVHNTEMWLFAGTGKKLCNDLTVFDIESGRWRSINTTGPKPVARFGHTCTALADSLLIVGGRGISKHLNEVWRFSFDEETWSRFSTSKGGPDGRAGHTTTLSADHKLLWVYGGHCARQKHDKAVYSLDWEANTWRKFKGNSTSPHSRSGHTVVMYDEKLLVFGGYDGHKYFNDLHQFCTVTHQWTKVIPKGTAPTRRSGHTATVVERRMFIIGGCAPDSRFLDDVNVLELDTMTWVDRVLVQNQAVFKARFQHTAAALGRSILLCAGTGNGNLLGDMISLSIPRSMFENRRISGSVDPAADALSLSRLSLQPQAPKEVANSGSHAVAMSSSALGSPSCRTSSSSISSSNSNSTSSSSDAAASNRGPRRGSSSNSSNNSSKRNSTSSMSPCRDSPTREREGADLSPTSLPDSAHLLDMYVAAVTSLKREQQKNTDLGGEVDLLQRKLDAELENRKSMADESAFQRGEALCSEEQLTRDLRRTKDAVQKHQAFTSRIQDSLQHTQTKCDKLTNEVQLLQGELRMRQLANDELHEEIERQRNEVDQTRHDLLITEAQIGRASCRERV
eukprot:TRINITY_DN534_c0_g1_i1.p1 TRINITY_DN534_c0_g1~~TRINITY_DN534_c0_g1_i1.p1  ORF type:complete len:621 (-),score=109.22 TRINITY_DN534_c0_g1_i1:99-1961(-)